MLHQTLDAEDRGAVYTRSEVVAFMLDLADYRDTVNLATLRALEPSAGDGAFATQIATRLIRS